MLKKEAHYQEHHFLSSDYSKLMKDPQIDDAWQSDIDSLSPYLERLTMREQRWLIGHAIHDQPPHNIAAKYGVSTETVKGWRKNAIKKLRNM
ncbi:FixJ family two-component response regulator [Geomicrobium halophilum]|uniref:FixJ family two-component response regulator n=1 Tax=Geomicrobium halophilum TaxID=549000 RepID=A0A841PZB2_9BACL|nr:sigma-70 family RNA polymerase sigma factor [Geomicrobium halophilum]MBB6449952.1 FixJ family two-component response regulator [Geomicrobium halophilum]